MITIRGAVTTSILRHRLALLTMFALMVPNVASAEPYLAVHKGLQCSACHSQPAGGGMRSTYGNVYAQTELAATRIGDSNDELWTGALTRWLRAGANLRGGYEYVDTSNRSSRSAFDVTRGTIYLEAQLIPNRLSVYIDQQIAPNASQNREAYVKLKTRSGKWHLLGGQFYLPYGLRLQDDTAFVRRVTGINFTKPDRGLQLGYESNRWSTQFSLTNGSGGGTETDTGKQLSIITQYIRPRWRVGASLNANDADAGDRHMANVFGGLRTGPVAWLAEADWIRDELSGTADQDGFVGLVEANWLFRKGHNIKASYDYFDPDLDVSQDHQVRYSLLWEYSPLQFLQGRIGVRVYDGPPVIDMQNREELFVELHGFF